MDNRVALITGGAKGIGRAIGLHLAGEGWAVAFCYRTSAQEAKETAEAIRPLAVEIFTGRGEPTANVIPRPQPAGCRL